jgi:maltose O-acetyltransferase
MSFFPFVKTKIAAWLLPALRKAERARIAEDNRKLMKRLKSCGRGCGFWGEISITGPEHMVLGENVHIGRNAFIRAEGGLSIGDNTHISRNLVLYTINHRWDGERIPYDNTMEAKPVQIGANVWIGMNVCIAPGTVIGDGAIIGMGTTLAGTIPPLSIVVNSPWRVVGQRNEDHYEDCLRRQAFGGPSGVQYGANAEQL